MSDVPRPRVELEMYSFATVRWAWETLWAAVHERSPWTPSTLTWSGDAHAGWGDESCVVTQVCGGPFVARHLDDLRLIGAFVLDLPDADDAANYHAVLLSPRDRPLVDLVTTSSRAAANSVDSLTGWLSLRAVTVGAQGTWPGSLTFTGSHHASVRALAAGAADVASIDPWSLSFIEAIEPRLLDRLHRVGVGPDIPVPPIAVRASLGDGAVAELRRAWSDACADASTAAARSVLHISDFVEADLSTYLAIAPLTVTP